MACNQKGDDGIVYWCIYGSLSIIELTLLPRKINLCCYMSTVHPVARASQINGIVERTCISFPLIHLCRTNPMQFTIDSVCVMTLPWIVPLTHWGRVTHICICKLTIIGSDNGLLPGQRRAIIWTNAGLLLIGPLGTNFSKILIEILTFSYKEMRLKVSSAKRRPFCLGLNVLNRYPDGKKPGIDIN